MQVASRVL